MSSGRKLRKMLSDHAKLVRSLMQDEPVSPNVSYLLAPAKGSAPRKRRRNGFYNTTAWKEARYDALKRAKGYCECCGAGPGSGAVLNVDHIEPLSTAWHRRLDPTNLQVLCGSCNQGKGRRDATDWR